MTAVSGRVVIIGGGPRGISVLERIIARSAAAPAAEIVLLDPYIEFGGRVWRVDQSADLLMNTMVADNTVFPDPSVRLPARVGTGPTFAQWLDAAARGADPGDAALRAYARATGERDYAPRAIYGRYLRDALDRVRASAPPHVRIRVIAAEAGDVRPLGAGYRVALGGGETLDAAAVVLATGHLDAAPAPPLPGTDLIGCGYPAEYPLDAISAGAEVLLRGAGLNAYDVIARLTLGRGGSFDAAGSYRRGGAEPHLWITSRRGVPLHARVDAPGLRAPRVFLGEDRVTELLDRPLLDFADDVLPLFRADLEIAWYAAMPRERAPGADLPGLLAVLRTAEPGDPERSAALAAVPAAARLDLDAVIDPLSGRRFAGADDLRTWWRGHLDRDYAAATAAVPPPEAALAAAVRQTRPVLRRIITAGTLTSGSYHRDVAGSANAWMNFLSGGPPAMRVRQLRALLDAGVVDLLGPTARAPAAGDRYTVASAVADGLTVTPDHVIDAWLPPVDVTSDGPGLLRRLLATGTARAHRLAASGGGRGAPTGALDVEPATGRVLDPAARPHPGLFAAGVPLEGLRWNTAIGARPGTDADFFHETDVIADAIVSEVLQGSAPAGLRPTEEIAG